MYALSLSVLTAVILGVPGLVGWFGAKDNGSGCDSTDKPTSNILQAGALPVSQATVLKDCLKGNSAGLIH